VCLFTTLLSIFLEDFEELIKVMLVIFLFYNNLVNSSTDKCACLMIWDNVDLLIGLCAGIVSFSDLSVVCFCKRM